MSVLSMMLIIALLLGCSTCWAHGRRVQSRSRDVWETLHEAKSLATLLLRSSPDEAFNPSHPGVQRPGVLRSDIWGRHASANDVRLLAPATAAARSERDSWADKSDVITQVEEQLIKGPVALVMRSDCMASQVVKNRLEKLGAQPELISLDVLDDSMAAEIEDHLETLTGIRKTPLLFIGQRFWGDADKTKQALEDGSLKKDLLQAYEDFRQDRAGTNDIALQRKSNKEWKKELKPKLYNSARLRIDEFPFTHRFAEFFPDQGYFSCAVCDLPLFTAESKFEPGIDAKRGWPAFDMCMHSEEIGCHLWTRADGSATEGLEIACRECGGHIGHVYWDDDRAENPNGERHTANGIALKYHEEDPSDDVWERKVTLIKT